MVLTEEAESNVGSYVWDCVSFIIHYNLFIPIFRSNYILFCNFFYYFNLFILLTKNQVPIYVQLF